MSAPCGRLCPEQGCEAWPTRPPSAYLFACFSVDAWLPVSFRALQPVTGMICIGMVPDLAGGGPESGCCVLCPPCHAARFLMSGSRALPLRGRGAGFTARSGHGRGGQASLVRLLSADRVSPAARVQWPLAGGWKRALVGLLHQGLGRRYSQGFFSGRMLDIQQHSLGVSAPRPPGTGVGSPRTSACASLHFPSRTASL